MTLIKTPERPVLNHEQLKRIEATHSGFLYQHLYSAACLLKLSSLDTGGVLIERDEDIEFETGDTVYFLQVKTRNRALQPSDLEDVLDHFSALRSKHKDRVGDKDMIFAVIANQASGPKLTKEISDWPQDVFYFYPGQDKGVHTVLPDVPSNIEDAVLICRALAEPLPFQSLQAETLVWKLAARVQFAATGQDGDRPTHRFDRSELSNLFEAFVAQLQEFPAVPDSYRPQENEPDLLSDNAARLIVGFSGAGKTLWAASQALHAVSPIGYFDIRNLPDTAIANSLAREMAARFVSFGSGDSARLPYGAGMDVLASLNALIESDTSPVMVLDNAQRCTPEIICDIVATCSNIRFVLLSQPGPEVAQLDIALGITHEVLEGWSRDTLASVFNAHDVKVSPALARRGLNVTGGLPLYVESAARICQQAYGGDAEAFLCEIEAGQHSQPVAQEVLLEQALQTLDIEKQQVIGLLSLANVPLNGEEIGALTANLETPPRNVVRALRDLSRTGLVQQFPNAMWKLHDAVTVPAQVLAEGFDDALTLAVLTALRDQLLASLMQQQDVVRLSAWTRLLAPTGQAEVLADVAMEEMFHEMGDPGDLKAVLEGLAIDNTVSLDTEFWALEALAFWDLQGDSRLHDPELRLNRMQSILDEQPDIDPFGLLRINYKRMMRAGSREDFQTIRDAFVICRRVAEGHPTHMRLARYNYAASLHMCGDYRRALPIAEALCQDYYDHLGIKVADVLGANNQRMVEIAGEITEGRQADLKHLADCLSLTAKIKRGLGQHPLFLAIHAAKFYHLAGARRSQMKVAQEFADDTLDMGDTEGAVLAMETYVLPILQHFQFDDEFVEVNSHYAVLLAFNGQIAAARRQMARLAPYVPELPQIYQDGLANQMRLIGEIERGERPAPSPMMRPPPVTQARPKIGRNAPCPCGSKRKYKKCCGGV